MSVRVLLIEDDPDFARGSQDFLAEAGFEVRSLRDALDLVAEIDAFVPDVVVLDLNLPGLDGFSAALAVLETPHARHRRPDRADRP